MRFADTLYLPFTQGLYNRKGNYISVILGETDKHRYRLDQIRDGDYPDVIIMKSEHTGNIRRFKFVRATVDWTDEDGWNDSITLLYYNEDMDVELVIAVSR